MSRHFGIGVGSILLFFLWVTLSVSGVQILTTPTPRPAALGWVYLAAGLAFAAVTTNLWRRVLPGIFACGSLNMIYMALAGHMIGQSKPVTESVAWVQTILLLIIAVVCAKASRSDHGIDIVDRVAYAIFFLSLTVAFAKEWAAIGALVCMIFAVGFVIFRHRRGARDSSSMAPT